MKPGTGNQHNSRKRRLLHALRVIRADLARGDWLLACAGLVLWREEWHRAPESTRRRWRCGR